MAWRNEACPGLLSEKSCVQNVSVKKSTRFLLFYRNMYKHPVVYSCMYMHYRSSLLRDGNYYLRRRLSHERFRWYSVKTYLHQRWRKRVYSLPMTHPPPPQKKSRGPLRCPTRTSREGVMRKLYVPLHASHWRRVVREY